MTNSEVAITGVIAKYGTTADGTGRLTIDFNEIETVQFQELFRGIYKGTTVVVARMADGPSETSEE